MYVSLKFNGSKFPSLCKKMKAIRGGRGGQTIVVIIIFVFRPKYYVKRNLSAISVN